MPFCWRNSRPWARIGPYGDAIHFFRRRLQLSIGPSRFLW